MAAGALRVIASRHFAEWLYENELSLAFTTYQTNRLFLLGVRPNGALSLFERYLERPMGLYATGERFYVSTRWQIWQFDNALPAGVLHNGYDRLYVPRRAFTTGDLDVHDLALGSDGRPIFVATLYSCLATISDRYSFRPLWWPPFITRIVPEDRCHLNGLAMANGAPAYVTAVSRSDVIGGWRDRRHTGGVVIDVEDNEIVLDTLSMPHSPRVYADRLWLLNSGSGELGWVDRRRGRFEPVCFCPGYLRGLAFYREWAIVGLSKQRQERTFQGLELDEKLKQKDAEARCGVYVVDLKTGNVSHWLELEGVVRELYDVAVLVGVRRPMALGFRSDEIQRFITIESDDGPRFEPLRTSEPPAQGGPPPPFEAGGEGSKPVEPAPPEYHQANQLARQGRYREAIALYEKVLGDYPTHSNSRINLGVAYFRLGEREKAMRLWQEVIEHDARAALAHANLARALRDEGQIHLAIHHWQQAIAVRRGDAALRLELVEALVSAGHTNEARMHAQAVIEGEPTNAHAWVALGAVLAYEQRHLEAIAHFERAIALDPNLFLAHRNLGQSAEAIGDIAQARDSYRRALSLRDDPVLTLRQELLCAPVLPDLATLDSYHQRSLGVIRAFLGRGLSIELSQVQTSGAEVPFNWAYHGRDYLAHRRAYAALFAQAFAEERRPLDYVPKDKPPWRVAFVVTPSHEGVFLRCTAGILDRIDRGCIRPVVACAEASFPEIRRNLRNPAYELLPLPHRFDHAVRALRAERFDAIYFWEVGTDATNYFLPFCRLAPVQCTGWGWPETSAAPELDFHFSSEMLAPPESDRFFAEPLIRQPHLPAFMSVPRQVRWEKVPLEHLGLPPGKHLYLCVQNLRKIHPEMDPLLEEILVADPDGVVAVVHDRYPVMGELLRERWRNTLARFAERLFILDRQDGAGYTRLLASATVLLDTLHFGGANTAYDAYLAAVPVVTLPGNHPRSRYTAALHTAAGVEGCTASTPSHYVALAVEFATNEQRRKDVCAAMIAGRHRIFERAEAAEQLVHTFRRIFRGELHPTRPVA